MSHLPVEVLHRIFTILSEDGTKTPLCRCAMVCKSWNRTAQHMLYTKSVIGYNSLSKYFRSVNQNRQLGILVKEVTFECKIDIHNIRKATNVLGHLLNLEVFRCKDGKWLSVLLDLLLDNNFPHLKSIHVSPLTEEDYGNYATCATLLKDKLENLIVTSRKTISNFKTRSKFVPTRTEDGNRERDDSMNGELHFNRLFRKLDQFPNLTELFITCGTGDQIDRLESVKTTLNKLHTLQFDFRDFNDFHKREEDDSITTSNYTPTPNVKTLQGYSVVYYSKRFLLYIMHKFPQLETLYLDTQYFKPSTILDGELAIQFFEYLSKISTITVYELSFASNTFFDIIKGCWRDYLDFAPKHLKITYVNKNPEVIKLDVSKGDANEEDSASITYPKPTGDVPDHYKIIEEFGKPVKVIEFTTCENLFRGATRSTLDITYGVFIDHILSNCPDLKELHIHDCKLKKNLFCVNFSKKSNQNRSLDTLEISDSIIRTDGVFQELSTAFKSLTYFKLHRNKYFYGCNIDMINTDVGTLIFEFFGVDYPEKPIYLKIITSAWEEYRYYKFDFDNMRGEELEDSNEDECDETSPYFIHIRCRSLRSFELYVDIQTLYKDFN